MLYLRLSSFSSLPPKLQVLIFISHVLYNNWTIYTLLLRPMSSSIGASSTSEAVENSSQALTLQNIHFKSMFFSWFIFWGDLKWAT